MAKIVNAFVYYVIVVPISILPLFLGYIFSTLFFLFTFIFPYRRKVIERNMKASFPEISEKELLQLRQKFYLHFADILLEGIKNLTISKKELLHRFKVANPEVMEKLHQEGKNVLLVAGHYNNWEFMITAQNLLFPHKAIGIGQPLTAKFWDKKINARRSRFGMHVVSSKNFKTELAKYKEPVAILMLSDQSPTDTRRSYWMEFLNQPTAVLFGVEQLAHTMNAAVVYFETEKVKRGKYLVHLKLITDNPSEMQWGEITIAHTQALEATIQKHPAYWLWSHKRWKREIPTDLEQLKKEQNNAFNQRFK